jgi:hypothetical protein
MSIERFPEEAPTPVGQRCFVCGQGIEDGDSGVTTQSTGQGPGPSDYRAVHAHAQCWDDWVAGEREAGFGDVPERPAAT